jgi:hypothetical protein
VLVLAAGCGGDEASAPTTVSLPEETQPLPPETQPPTEPAALTPLPAELVGTWTVTAQDPSGQTIRRQYVFSSDGRYGYTLGLCRSSTDCSFVSQEAGIAQAAGGVVSLEPQTEPNDGARQLPYVVTRDPVVGDAQLQLQLPDGTQDVFYFGQ